MNKARVIQMRIGLAAAMAMLVVVIGGGSAIAQVTQDSTTWEGSYECDDTPVAAGWENIWGYDDVAIVVADPCDPSNNYIHVDNDGEELAGFRLAEDPGDFDPSANGGISIELRVRAIAGDFFFHMWTSAAGPNGNYRWLATDITPTAATIKDSDQYDSVSAGFDDPNDPNNAGWHTYRITCDDTDWTLYRFRYDNPDDPNYTGWITTPVVGAYGPATGYQIDLYGIQGFAVFDIDYIRWTDQGALLPGPPSECGEPGTEYKLTDVNSDCYVDKQDLADLAAEWLQCTDPGNEGCDQYWK